jgi:hypothetical protein
LNYSPNLLLQLVEMRGNYLNASPLGFPLELLGALLPSWQRQVCDIEVQTRMTGQVLTWQHVKAEFLKLSGHTVIRSARAALAQLLDCNDKAIFQNKVRELGKPLYDSIAVQMFLPGLIPATKEKSLTDHLGCPHATLTAAYDYAHSVELRLAMSKVTHPCSFELPLAHVRFFRRSASIVARARAVRAKAARAVSAARECTSSSRPLNPVGRGGHVPARPTPVVGFKVFVAIMALVLVLVVVGSEAGQARSEAGRVRALLAQR